MEDTKPTTATRPWTSGALDEVVVIVVAIAAPLLFRPLEAPRPLVDPLHHNPMFAPTEILSPT